MMQLFKHRKNEPERATQTQRAIAAVDRGTREDYMRCVAEGLISDVESCGGAVVAVELIYVNPYGALGFSSREPWSADEIEQGVGA